MNVARTLRGRGGQQGQVLVLAALSIVALLAMVGLIIDGGNAFAQQRITQNGADASAEAGDTVLMKKLVGVTGQDTTAVNSAVQAVAAANQLATPVLACYTNLAGTPLDTAGTLVTDCSGAAKVGQDAIPYCAECPGFTAAGVRVYGSRPFGTYIAHVVGIDTLTASATATAIAGYVDAYGGPVLPVTLPVLAVGCTGTGAAQDVTAGTYAWPSGVEMSVPLCGNSPGNVGWIDWTPTAGGASELANAILGNPPNPAIITPRWYYVTSTGNVNSGPVQTAMDHWNGTDIMLPIFDGTCNNTPANLSDPVGDIGDCVAGGGHLGGTGSNQWYFLVGFAEFHLTESFINGQDTLHQCDAYDLAGGNGMTSCLIGSFVKNPAVSTHTGVGAGGGSDNFKSPPGVQLIR